MTAIQPFAPKIGGTVTVTPGAASAAAQFDAQRLNNQVQFVNTGANICYVRLYDSSVTNPAPSATTSDYPIPSNMARTITKSQSHDSFAYISAAGTTLSATPGEGF